MVEPATVAFHGVHRSGLRLGDTVVVQGVGPIGAFALQWARINGAGQVLGRRAQPRPVPNWPDGWVADAVLATGEEAQAAVLERTGGLGADVVIECAGIPSTIQSAGRPGAPGLATSPSSGSRTCPPPSRPPPGWWKEVVVRGSIAYVRADFDLCMGMLADVACPGPPAAHVHRRARRINAAFDLLAGAGAATETKILVQPG